MRVYCRVSTHFFVFARLLKNYWWLLRKDCLVYHHIDQMSSYPWVSWVSVEIQMLLYSLTTSRSPACINGVPAKLAERNTSRILLVLTASPLGWQVNQHATLPFVTGHHSIPSLCILAYWSLHHKLHNSVYLLNKHLLFRPTPIHSLPLQRHRKRSYPWNTDRTEFHLVNSSIV